MKTKYGGAEARVSGVSLGVVSASAIPGWWSGDGLGCPSTQVSLRPEGLWPQVALIDSEWEV